MSGEEDVDEESLASGRGWFVPVVVSEPRTDVDKAGKPSVIFDCIYNASLKSRTLRDVSFKTFLIELALQRVEVQHNLSLSRQIGTPNIASKGKLAPRTALVPLALFPISHALRANAAANQKKLIEEVNVAVEATRAPSSRIAEPAKPKGILKNGTENPTQVPTQATPKFEWTKDDRCIQIRLQMPGLARDDISSATLDVEPRRIILDVPAKYHLDVDLSMSDAQIVATFGATSSEGSALMLKRQRDFDVDNAAAEWRVQEGVVLITV
ncbi:hypothetical protein PHLGIDRAFT_67555 [Phlebiopsis gigantea 11061_1 CR5-6]|uniref:PIH1 N-terminal domain-containing protein n=1 Tax=Phlebiopsis gigantea (strain 11061_1 CR5-6) TaxID=745531 RepID=A0A0C3NVN6_PHLG1|nr:hypothetical protein PHLGIDRAFT_67555 [Phlebiopsis gigantea 11061_1 CR5-6]